MSSPPTTRPEKVGPYRLEELLGTGGMGEVYRAHDERLDRLVAVKHVRPDAEESPRLRERFRREARAAARLNHPAIVQIHDVVEDERGDWIVMELVEGRSLATRIEEGPLPLAETVAIARQVAEGLAEAHAKGIVHRDLKSENVMVTPAGSAKILDFGLAKRVTAGEAGDPTLSIAGRLLGTCRTMSPEQALDGRVDHRSDLFSLGILLYELMTGISPFLGTTTAATLTKICTFQQRPVAELDPAVPPALSDLIDELLAKDPARRPQSAGEVARRLEGILAALPPSAHRAARRANLDREIASLPATMVDGEIARLTGAYSISLSRERVLPRVKVPFWRSRPLLTAAVLLAIVTAGAGVSLALLRGRAKPLYVAAPAPEVGTGAGLDGIDLAASAVRVGLLHGLVAIEGVSPLAPEQVDAAAGSPIDLARALAADEVVTTRLDCRQQTCQASLSRVSGTDGSLLWTDSFEVPVDDPYLISTSVLQHLRRGYPDRGLRTGTPRLEVQPQDYRDFLDLQNGLTERRDQTPLSGYLDRLEAIRRSSPRFPDVDLLEARVAQQRFNEETHDKADLDRAFDLLARARELDPGDPRPLLAVFSLALGASRTAEADSALAELERLRPGDANVLAKRAELLEQNGDKPGALAAMRTAVARHPSLKLLFDLANMEYRCGEIDSARVHLHELLRRAPGHYDGQSLLASLELANGDPNRAVALYTELVQRSPGLAELSNLGLARFLLGHYQEAAESFARAVDQAPKNPFALLNLADTYQLLGRRSEAAELYNRVVDLVENDPTAGQAQMLTVRGQALAHLGRGREAVAAAQKALQASPQNPQIAYEASLIYALAGDNNSAVINAEHALDLGFEPRWFSFPWFDTVRSAPELAARLKGEAAGGAR